MSHPNALIGGSSACLSLHSPSPCTICTPTAHVQRAEAELNSVLRTQETMKAEIDRIRMELEMKDRELVRLREAAASSSTLVTPQSSVSQLQPHVELGSVSHGGQQHYSQQEINGHSQPLPPPPIPDPCFNLGAKDGTASLAMHSLHGLAPPPSTMHSFGALAQQVYMDPAVQVPAAAPILDLPKPSADDGDNSSTISAASHLQTSTSGATSAAGAFGTAMALHQPSLPSLRELALPRPNGVFSQDSEYSDAPWLSRASPNPNANLPLRPPPRGPRPPPRDPAVVCVLGGGTCCVSILNAVAIQTVRCIPISCPWAGHRS